MQKVLVARDRNGQFVGAVTLSNTPASVGRSHGASLVLPSTAVSRVHAMSYLQADGQAVITDEGSANGVLVDGQRILGPTLVAEHNQIEVSEFMLRVEAEVQQQAQPQVVQQHLQQPEVEVEEMPTMLEPYAGAAQALANNSLQLVGRGGTFDGTFLDLEKPLIFVGRTEENELPLNDPSISRRHAQIRIAPTADRFTLIDLRSSNGTFVDGKLIKRAECTPGSVVRFGELVFRVDSKQDTAPRRASKQRSGKLLVMASAAVFLVLCAVGVVAYVTREKPPPPKVITAEERLRQLQADVQRFVDEGKSRLKLKEWSAAIVALDKALAKDPLNTDSTTMRKEALFELENEKIYEKGLKYYALHTEENLVKAREIFRKVSKRSIYQREVRYKIKTINERLASEYRIKGMSQCKAKYYHKCQRLLCKFFHLLPSDKSVAGEANVRKELQRAEKRSRRRRGFKACTAPRFHNPVEEVVKADPQKLLAEKYPVAGIREVVTIYIQGKTAPALVKLTNLKKKRRMKPHLTVIAEVNRQLNVIRGKYEEGFGAYRARKVADAQKNWDMVLEADKALVPAQIESFHRKEITRFLGDLYFELGDEQFKLKRWRQAASYWFKGKKAAPRHQKVLNGILQLKNEGEKLLKAGKGLAAAGNVSEARTSLTMAKDITEEKTTLNGEAVKALAALGK